MNSRVTIADIAKELGISPSTVSRALRDNPAISKSRRIEVRAAAETLGFDLPAGAPAQKAQREWLIGCVVPSISHPFFADIIERLESLCARNGCDLLLHNSGGSPAMESAIVQRLGERDVDGVVFIPCSLDMEPLKECIHYHKTVVVTQQTALCPSIGIDHEEGGRQVAEHFKELGRHSCLLVGPPGDSKFSGFRSYIESQCLTNFKIDDIDVDGWDAGFVLDAHKAIVDRFDSESIKQFDCVFAKTDLAAVGTIHALNELGRSVPGDIAVCGFDDTPLAREVRPGLSSVAQPVGQIVNFGFTLLQKMVNGKEIPQGQQSYSLRPHLVVRGSTFPGASG
jgi:LacI family transcriptional regulator